MSQVQQAMQVSFSITQCKCTSFSLSEFGLKNTQEIPVDKYQFQIDVNLSIEESKKLVSIKVLTTLFYNGEQKQIIATLESMHAFLIVNFEEVIFRRPEGVSLPDRIMQTLFSICMSNVRGMYSVKLENTKYADVVMPMIDANLFLPRPTPTIG